MMMMSIKYSLWIPLVAIAACTQPDTIVHVELTAGATSTTLDTYELRIGSGLAQAEVLPAIDLALPDRMAGQLEMLEVWGLASGVQVAYGTVTVTPALHKTIDVTVTLGALDCGQWCIEGGGECMGSGTVTCTEGSDGCLAWSDPTPCPADVTCTNGACGGSSAPVACEMDGSPCDDGNLCTNHDTCESGVCLGQQMCTAAPANGDPTCSNGTCGFTCHAGYVNTGTSCVIPEIVFTTSTTSNGNLGGLAGADATCQSLATAAGLHGTYKAWLSDSTTAALTRLAHVDGYALVDGTIVATSWAQLTSGTLLHAIDLDEHGMSLASDGTWTDTSANGSIEDNINNVPLDCDGWTSNHDNPDDPDSTAAGFGGQASATDKTWTDTSEAYLCNTTARLYCLQQ